MRIRSSSGLTDMLRSPVQTSCRRRGCFDSCLLQVSRVDCRAQKPMPPMPGIPPPMPGMPAHATHATHAAHGIAMIVAVAVVVLAFVLDRDVDDGAIGGEKQRRDACRVLQARFDRPSRA